MQRKTRFSFWGLTPQLFFFIVLPLTTLFILVTFGSLAAHQRAMRDLVGERDVRAVRTAANALLEQLNHRRVAVQTLATSAAAQGEGAGNLPLETLLSRSKYLLPFFDKGLAFFGADGELLVGTGPAGFWQQLAAIPEFDQLLVPSNPAQITSVSHPSSEDALILIGYAPPQGPAAVGALSPADLIGRALVDVIEPSQGSVAFVVDGAGRLLFLAGEPLEQEDLALHPGVAQALKGISGATYLTNGGVEHVVAYSPVPLVGWALVVEEPWEMVTTPLLDLTENAPLVLIPVVLLLMMALWFATQRIVQPLKILEARTARLAWGDFAAIEEPVGGITEIRHLQRALVHMANRLRAAQQGLRNYIGAITQGQEEERRRLARELHDDTIQALIALKQRVQLAELSLNGSPQLEGLKEIEGLTDQTIQNLRRITRALRPIYLEDLGLMPALEMLAREIQEVSSIQVQFERSGIERRLPPLTELALYRIAQEALNNAVRHSGATTAAVQIHFLDEEIKLQVRDNGVGFSVPESPAEFAPGGHQGLLGLYERAEMIGARLKIESKLGEGTLVTVAVPRGNED